METFRFFEFQVYKEAKSIYRDILRVSESISIRSLQDQLQRASLSIILNIAEGSAKYSDREFARYLQVALGSVNETMACLELLRELGHIRQNIFTSYFERLESIAKQLGGFSKKLRSKL